MRFRQTSKAISDGCDGNSKWCVIVGALRGGGWNVATYVDEPAVFASEIVGSTRSADRLRHVFRIVDRRAGRETVLKIGTDLRPGVGSAVEIH